MDNRRDRILATFKQEWPLLLLIAGYPFLVCLGLWLTRPHPPEKTYKPEQPQHSRRFVVHPAPPLPLLPPLPPLQLRP